MRYANIRRQWVLHDNLWCLVDPEQSFPQCDGAIVAGIGGGKFEYIQDNCTHLVSCSGETFDSNIPTVCLDDQAVGRMAAQHLLDCRLRQFAFYGYTDERRVALHRFQGFADGLRARGHSCHVSATPWPSGNQWLTHEHHPEVIRWLKELPKPIGIMAADDASAHDLAGACLEADIGVPDQVAIIGVNNDDLLCESSWPPLSSIDGDYMRMGYQAAALLDQMMRGQTLGFEQCHIMLPPVSAVQRVSTSVLAVSDPHLAKAVRYIREHACDPCNVQDVLKQVPVARRWLERQFMQQLGRSPYQEIQRVRIDAAKRLLQDSNMTLPDVAEHCGFTAVQNFNTAFKQVAQTTPAAYRRIIQQYE
jgi:LacI family transcriptional regulator